MVHSLDQTGRIARDHPLFKYHTARILELEFGNFDENIIATTSDDCTVKICKFPEEITESVLKEDVNLTGHSKKATSLAWHPTAENVLASAGTDKQLIIWDVENGEDAINIDDHEDLIYSIIWNQNGSLIASSCQDRIIRMMDPRDEDAVVLTVEGHENKKISKVFWVNNRNLVGSIGFTKDSFRELLFFDVRKLEKPFHRLQLDRQNSKFYPYFEESNDILFLSGKGDTGIRAYELSEQEGFCHPITELKTLEPHKGIAVFPRRALDTKKVEIFKVLRLKSNAVEKMSVCVPRRNANLVFQEDLYPDCYAGKAAMTIDEYFDGKNADAIKESMNPDSIDGEKSEGGRFRRRNRTTTPKEAPKPVAASKTPRTESAAMTSQEAAPTQRGTRRGGAKKRESHAASPLKEKDKPKASLEKPSPEPKGAAFFRELSQSKEVSKADTGSGEKALKDAQSKIKDLEAKLAEKEKAITQLEKEKADSEALVKSLQEKLKDAPSGKGSGEEMDRLKRLAKKLKRKYRKKEEDLEEMEEVINKQAATIKEQNRKLAQYEN